MCCLHGACMCLQGTVRGVCGGVFPSMATGLGSLPPATGGTLPAGSDVLCSTRPQSWLQRTLPLPENSKYSVLTPLYIVYM